MADWVTEGNVTDADDFLGTRNNRALIIKTNTDNAPANLEEVMRITASSTTTGRGDVGIGTPQPVTALGASGQALHVDNPTGGSALRLGAASPGEQWEWQSTVIAGTAAMNLSKVTAKPGQTPLNPFTVLENGRVGIGRLDPVQALHVNGNIRADLITAVGEIDTLTNVFARNKVTALGDLVTQGNLGIGTEIPDHRLDLRGGNMRLTDAMAGTEGNLYFGGITDQGQTGMRLFGGFVNNSEPAGFIDVRSTDATDGLRIRVDTASGGTERMRVTSNNVQAFGTIVAGSDARTKTNIRQLAGILDKLEHLHGVAFKWAESPQTPTGVPGEPGIGVIAQEVEEVFPELVSEYGDHGYKAVDYSGLTSVLVEAAKELKAENVELRSRIEALEI